MESNSQRAENKKSLLSIGVLMLSLAALQSPLWRSQQEVVPIAVRSGGAMLVAVDRPIAGVKIDQTQHASAEVVGDHEVLVRGKSMGDAQLIIAAKDGYSRTYRVTVQSESAQSLFQSLISR